MNDKILLQLDLTEIQDNIRQLTAQLENERSLIAICVKHNLLEEVLEISRDMINTERKIYLYTELDKDNYSEFLIKLGQILLCCSDPHVNKVEIEFLKEVLG